MKAVQDGSPITTAARIHGVPKTSLHNRIKRKVFDLLVKTLKDNNLVNKPAQIYNVNKTGMAYEHCESGNKAQTTVVAYVNAIGQAIPSYVIYNAKTLNPEWMKDVLIVKMG